MPKRPKTKKPGSPEEQAGNRRDKVPPDCPETGAEGRLEAPEGGWGGKNPPPPETRFKPGQSGNPGGRPKGTSLTARLRDNLDRDDGRWAEGIVRMLIAEAAKGKFQHIREIFDRVDGSVVQRFQIDTALDEMLRTAERVLERGQYAKLVAALAGESSERSGAHASGEEQVH